jgi:hypothetical protein
LGLLERGNCTHWTTIVTQLKLYVSGYDQILSTGDNKKIDSFCLRTETESVSKMLCSVQNSRQWTKSRKPVIIFKMDLEEMGQEDVDRVCVDMVMNLLML